MSPGEETEAPRLRGGREEGAVLVPCSFGRLRDQLFLGSGWRGDEREGG